MPLRRGPLQNPRLRSCHSRSCRFRLNRVRLNRCQHRLFRLVRRRSHRLKHCLMQRCPKLNRKARPSHRYRSVAWTAQECRLKPMLASKRAGSRGRILALESFDKKGPTHSHHRCCLDRSVHLRFGSNRQQKTKARQAMLPEAWPKKTENRRASLSLVLGAQAARWARFSFVQDTRDHVHIAMLLMKPDRASPSPPQRQRRTFRTEMHSQAKTQATHKSARDLPSTSPQRRSPRREK